MGSKTFAFTLVVAVILIATIAAVTTHAQVIETPRTIDWREPLPTEADHSLRHYMQIGRADVEADRMAAEVIREQTAAIQEQTAVLARIAAAQEQQAVEVARLATAVENLTIDASFVIPDDVREALVGAMTAIVRWLDVEPAQQ